MPSYPGPALYRSGDIGVSAEWRAISYDWLPVLTAHGVAIYSYLRDTYDQQRVMFPFLLSPQGPTKAQIQQRLGKKTAWTIQGPEFLLSAVGLLHVELRYGASSDPAQPHKTRVAYYSIGRLDQPALDWPMLDRVLDAVSLGLDASSADPTHKKAAAALDSLKHAGFLQNCDPAALFWELGAWPSLLPNLIADPRWEALYTHLHGADAVRRYRDQARRWVENAQRTLSRLAAANHEMAELLKSAQRRGGAPGGSLPPVPTGSDSSGQTPVTEPVGMTQTGSVTHESLGSHWPVGVTRTASVTREHGSLSHAINPDSPDPPAESLARDQLMLTVCSGHDVTPEKITVTPPGDSLVCVSSHFREQELYTIRLDTSFWCEVNRILTGKTDRYPHSPGEKQAAVRGFYRRQIPTGIVLAALRVVMTLPVECRPRSFADALKLDMFHLAVHQGIMLLPGQPPHGQSWEHFLWAYRTVGLETGVRDVGPADYTVLRSLYDRCAAECWEVLSRVEHASSSIDLTPRYLQRAIVNNQQASAGQSLLSNGKPAPCHPGESQGTFAPPSVDRRRELLVAEGINPTLLTPEMSEEFIRAWIAEADARGASLNNRPGWISWGLRSGYLPHQHPALPARTPGNGSPQIPPSQPVPGASSGEPPIDADLVNIWASARQVLQQTVPANEYDTWLNETCLIARSRTDAVIAVPNIFALEKIEERFLEMLRTALAVVGSSVDAIRVVIDTRAGLYTDRGVF